MTFFDNSNFQTFYFLKLCPFFVDSAWICSYILTLFLGDERDAEKFQVTITLFREEEYGRTSTNGDQGAFSAQRSYTGPVSISDRNYGYRFFVS